MSIESGVAILAGLIAIVCSAAVLWTMLASGKLQSIIGELKMENIDLRTKYQNLYQEYIIATRSASVWENRCFDVTENRDILLAIIDRWNKRTENKCE